MTVPNQIQLRYLVDVTSGATPESGNADYWDGDILWITPEDVGTLKGYWISDTRRKITLAGYQSCGTTITPRGSIVLTKRAPIGQGAILAEEACCNQGCFLLVPRDEVHAQFYYYWLRANKDILQALGRGSTFMELSTDDLKSVHVPHLALAQQHAIVDYLDRETARLDKLVEQKERLLELVSEKRRALISGAVLRGVERGTSLRESGVPWIGQIPAHWKVERAKWLFRERDERSATGEEELLTVSHLTGVTPRSEKEVNMFEAETTEGYKVCHAGDLVINTLWAWNGAMGVSPMLGIVSPAYHVYAPCRELLPEYVDALVRIPIFATEVTRYSKGVWSSRLRLYPEGFFETWLPVPPINEQHAIVRYVQSETAQLDSLWSATQRSIAFLKERRDALISAAVTGQLKVV